jgi:hypothetical protein
MAFGLVTARASADSCPNAGFRVGLSASLPDCRAYEMVSPADTNNDDILFGDDVVTPGGTAITYDSLGAFAGNPAGPTLSEYLSTRGASGWSTQGISLALTPAATASNFDLYEGFSADLSQGVVLGDDCADCTPQPSPPATTGTANLYRRSSDGSVQLLTIGEPAGQSGVNPTFAGGSTDYSVLAFEDTNALAAAPCPVPPGPCAASENVYRWTSGSPPSFANVVPGPPGSPPVVVSGVVGSGATQGTTSRAVSADGSRIFWTRIGTPASIYLFAGGPSTEITASQCTSNPHGCTTGSGGGTYWTASTGTANTDGSKAFFTSTDKLTNNSTASTNAANGDLYMYDAGTSTPTLTDLTAPDNLDPKGADVQGVIGASDDGSYVYFVANGKLSGAPARGTCGSGVAGASCNLYLSQNSVVNAKIVTTTTFVATVKDTDSADWALTMPAPLSYHAQVSADGHHLLYTSHDNAGHTEIYLYNAASGNAPAQLICVSCIPHPQGDAVLAAPSYLQPRLDRAPLEAASNMSSDGARVFFETNDALVPQDTNGTDDVYEWEAEGAGDCVTPGGCIALISSGRSPYPSYFENATPSGDDVFFLTRDPLVPEDTQGAQALYDARADGGFPPPTAAPPPCSSDVCHGPPTAAPGAPAAATITFVGPANSTTGSATEATVKVRHRVVHGTSFFVHVTVPAAGVITIGGGWLRRVRRAVGGPGTYVLRGALAPQGRRALARHHKLKVKASIGYQPTGAQISSTTVRVTFVRRRR